MTDQSRPSAVPRERCSTAGKPATDTWRRRNHPVIFVHVAERFSRGGGVRVERILRVLAADDHQRRLIARSHRRDGVGQRLARRRDQFPTRRLIHLESVGEVHVLVAANFVADHERFRSGRRRWGRYGRRRRCGSHALYLGCGNLRLRGGTAAAPALTGARIGAIAFASGEPLAEAAGSFATAGTTLGVAAEDGAAGAFALGFGSESFFVAMMLMSATLSFWMRANPYEVSTRNESFSKPTIVPMILVPSFRRISSARAAPALNSNERRARPKD